MDRDRRCGLEPGRRRRPRRHPRRVGGWKASVASSRSVWRRSIGRTHRRFDDLRMTEDTLPVTRVAPPSGWIQLGLSEAFAYRELVAFLIWRDIKVRYKQTTLGVLWAWVQPVMTMVVFTVVFGRLAGLPSDGVPYPVFTLAGLMPWQLFASAVR